MEDVYEHSITFTRTYFGQSVSKNTWQHWRLVPKEKPVFDAAKMRFENQDSPYINGSIDLTGILDGEVHRENREGTWEFILMNERDTISTFTSIMGFLHGQQVQITLHDDPGRVYIGNVTVESMQSNSDYATISIKYSVLPQYIKNWVWDTFNFTKDSVPTVKYGGLLADIMYQPVNNS